MLLTPGYPYLLLLTFSATKVKKKQFPFEYFHHFPFRKFLWFECWQKMLLELCSRVVFWWMDMEGIIWRLRIEKWTGNGCET